MAYVVAGDEDATERLREQIRRDRLADAEPPRAQAGGAPGTPVARLGLALLVTESENALQIECDCGYVLAPAGENWKLASARRHVDLRDLPLVVHRDLELVEYLCPACATVHAVKVEERGTGPLHDVKLGDPHSVRRPERLEALAAQARSR